MSAEVQKIDLQSLIGKDPSKFSDLELQAIYQAEMAGTLVPGELPLEDQSVRERSLVSPSYFVTEVVSSFYKKHFERRHYELIDDVLAPYLLGEPVEFDGTVYDPGKYLGLLVLLPRGLYKSSVLRWMGLWISLYRRLKLDTDARVMYVHQVIKKAIKAGEGIRSVAKFNTKFRRAFPEFKAPEGEWDTKEEWRWPNFGTHEASEFSFTAYGESSDKTGGHYTDRLVDDWETEKSVNTPDTLEGSWEAFEMMNNLEDLSADFNPYVVCGTTYHWQGVHKRLERHGGWIVYRVPAYKGSVKTLFDLAALDPRDAGQARRIEVGIKRLEDERPNDLNFPILYGWRKLYDKARGGRTSFGGQQGLDPTPEGDRRFSHDDVDAVWVRSEDVPPPGELWCYVRCDPALGRKKHNDECAILVGGVDWMGTRWVVDGWCGREKRPSEIVRKMFRFARSWQDRGYKVVNIGIEAVAFQESLAQSCRDGVPEREAREHNEQLKILKSPCPVRSIQRSGDMRKHERILEMEPYLTRRELKVWSELDVGRKLTDQLKNFPHDRDDLLDALHDLWEATLVPPRQREESGVPMHSVWKRLKRQRQGQKGLQDAHGSTSLSAWG